MKTVGNLLLLLGTLAALAAGLFLPDIILSHNRQTALAPQRYSIETIQLDAAEQPAALADTLRLVCGGPKRIRLEGGSVRTADQARQAAQELLAFMAQHGAALEADAYTVHSETAVLLYSETGEAAVAWECMLTTADEDSFIQILLDDATGVMLAFRQAEILDAWHIAADLMAASWAELCAQYYGFQAGRAMGTGKNSEGAHYTLAFTDASGQALALPFQIRYLETAVSSEAAPADTSSRIIVQFNMPDQLFFE